VRDRQNIENNPMQSSRIPPAPVNSGKGRMVAAAP